MTPASHTLYALTLFLALAALKLWSERRHRQSAFRRQVICSALRRRNVFNLAGEKYPNGLRVIGEDGWIRVSRANHVPGRPSGSLPGPQALDASDRKMLATGIKDGEIHPQASPQNDHHPDWLISVRTRQEPAAPADAGHRSCSACLISHAAMRVNRGLQWDPKTERFRNNEETNRMLSRKHRAPYGANCVAEKMGRILPGKPAYGWSAWRENV